jgi:hypothetical protein
MDSMQQANEEEERGTTGPPPEPAQEPSTPSNDEKVLRPPTPSAFESKVGQFAQQYTNLQEELREAQATSAAHAPKMLEAAERESALRRKTLEQAHKLEQMEKHLIFAQGTQGGVASARPQIEGRRTSMYRGIEHHEPIPKILTSGDAITKLRKFEGLPSENILEHLLDFKAAVRHYSPAFWLDLAMLTLSPKVLKETTRHGETLESNRDQQGCVANWVDYDELERWLKSRFIRPQHSVEQITALLWPTTKVKETDLYLTFINTKMATLDSKFDTNTKIALALHHMDPRVVRAMRAKPSTYSTTWSEFCHASRLIADSINAANTQAIITPHVAKTFVRGKNHSVNAIEKAKVAPHHILNKNGRDYLSPWAPGVDTNETSNPPCRYCRDGSHGITKCAKLWMKYYGKEPSMTQPPWVAQHLQERAQAQSNHDGRHVASIGRSRSTLEKTDPLEDDLYGIASLECDVTYETDFGSLYDSYVIDDVAAMDLLAPEPYISALDEPCPPSINPHGERIEIPNHLIYMSKGQNRFIIDVLVDGVSCKALVDSGAGVTGISKDFYTRSEIPTRPTALRPMACRSITGEVMNTTQVLNDVSFSMGPFRSTESFLLLPISRAYEVLLGMDFMIRNKVKLNCDDQASCHLSLVSTRTGPDIASLLPCWNEQFGVLDGVYDLCALSMHEGFEEEISIVKDDQTFMESKDTPLANSHDNQPSDESVSPTPHSTPTKIPFSAPPEPCWVPSSMKIGEEKSNGIPHRDKEEEGYEEAPLSTKSPSLPLGETNLGLKGCATDLEKYGFSPSMAIELSKALRGLQDGAYEVKVETSTNFRRTDFRKTTSPSQDFPKEAKGCDQKPKTEEPTTSPVSSLSSSPKPKTKEPTTDPVSSSSSSLPISFPQDQQDDLDRKWQDMVLQTFHEGERPHLAKSRIQALRDIHELLKNCAPKDPTIYLGLKIYPLTRDLRSQLLRQVATLLDAPRPQGLGGVDDIARPSSTLPPSPEPKLIFKDDTVLVLQTKNSQRHLRRYHLLHLTSGSKPHTVASIILAWIQTQSPDPSKSNDKEQYPLIRVPFNRTRQQGTRIKAPPQTRQDIYFLHAVWTQVIHGVTQRFSDTMARDLLYRFHDTLGRSFLAHRPSIEGASTFRLHKGPYAHLPSRIPFPIQRLVGVVLPFELRPERLGHNSVPPKAFPQCEVKPSFTCPCEDDYYPSTQAPDVGNPLNQPIPVPAPKPSKGHAFPRPSREAQRLRTHDPEHRSSGFGRGIDFSIHATFHDQSDYG